MSKVPFKKISVACIACALVFGAGRRPAAAQDLVRAWKEPLVIPTYAPGQPERNPVFYGGRAYQGAKGPVYPYPLLDRLSDVRRDKTYQAVYLENPYVRICVLPEIGGRIFEAVDKTNGYHFFYRQHVVKPALIGMLGAWISGGVEWNIPHHHRATSFMPVDCRIEEGPDGAKTVWVGEIELRHRMKWLVGMTLRPRSSVLEVTLKIMNRTPLAHSMLCFVNAAVHANGNYQIIFPPSAEFATFHGKNQFSRWPISREVFNGQDYRRGVDVSRWKNHSAPTSFFAWNHEEDFLAGYDHGKKAGIAFVADHHTVPGKKLWTWGTGTEGKYWDKILTDEDGPYLELMVGSYSDNQPDYSWIQPYETRTVKQYWYPLRELGGLKAANAGAACNLDITGKGMVTVALNATSDLPAARVRLEAGSRTVFEDQADIGPGRPYRRSFRAPDGIDHRTGLVLSLRSRDGRSVIRYSYSPRPETAEDLPKPVSPPPPPRDIQTVEELYLTGLRLEQFYNPAAEPWPYYEEALRRDPGETRVNTALALLDLKRGRYGEAEARLKKALERLSFNYTRPKDGEALYYLGLALRAQGKDKDAEDAFHKAAWSQAWNSGSLYQLAELACRKKDFSKALEFLSRSLETNGMNPKAFNLMSAARRHSGCPDAALDAASRAASLDPLDAWAMNEVCLVKLQKNGPDEARKLLAEFDARLKANLPGLLELSMDYANAGLWNEAADILRRAAGAEDPADSPFVYYWLGYFCHKLGADREASEYAARGAASSPDYGFPFQMEAAEILRWARGLNPGDARAPYYLGNLLFDHQPEAAVKAWEAAAVLDPDYSVVHRNLGLAYARLNGDLPKAIASYDKALAADPMDARIYAERDELAEAAGISVEERLALLEKNGPVVSGHDEALARKIGLLIRAGRYDRAIELLKSHHFHIWEGGGDVHGLLVDARLLRGRERARAGKPREALEDFKAALDYPDNLEAGPPASGPGSAKVYYFLAKAYGSLGAAGESRSHYEKAAARPEEASEEGYFRARALGELGKENDAKKAFEELVRQARARLESAPAMDFFEKFGEKKSSRLHKAQSHYLLGLGLLGLGENEPARNEFRKALESDAAHVWAGFFLAECDSVKKRA